MEVCHLSVFSRARRSEDSAERGYGKVSKRPQIRARRASRSSSTSSAFRVRRAFHFRRAPFQPTAVPATEDSATGRKDTDKQSVTNPCKTQREGGNDSPGAPGKDSSQAKPIRGGACRAPRYRSSREPSHRKESRTDRALAFSPGRKELFVQPADRADRPPLVFVETRRFAGKRPESLTHYPPAGTREHARKGC